MLAREEMNVTARFVPDYQRLYTAATHSALRDWDGHIWAWSGDLSTPAKTGSAWLHSEDGMPLLSATGTLF